MLEVGVLEAKLHLRSSHSLKEKRRVVRQIKDRVKARFNVSVAEVDDQDLWQSIVLGFAAVGSDSKYVAAQLDDILRQLRVHPEADLVDHNLEIL